MRINDFYGKTVEFFRKNTTRYGCIAVVEKMLLSSFDDDLIKSENAMPVVNTQTQHIPLYDPDIPYVREKKEEIDREREIQRRREQWARRPKKR